MLTEHRRTKLGHLPGELNLGWLIGLREARGEYEHELMPGFTVSERDGRSVRRYLKHKGRTVQRQRDRQVTLAALGEL